MLNELKAQLQGTYTIENVKELEQMESLLRLEHFNSGDALKLGNQIVLEAKKFGGDLAVRIIRMEDRLPVFQYVGEGKSQRNLDFATKKGNTVEATGHCSLWALVKEAAGGSVPAVFREDSDCLPVGGAFPLYVGEEMAAVVMTSGLHDGMDHMAVLNALCVIRDCEIPPFHGKCI